MRRNLVWALGAGTTVQFWNHRWVTNIDGPLNEVVVQRIPDHMLYRSVDYFVDGSAWDWSKFQHLLPAEIIDLIASIMPPSVSQGEDEVFWGLSSSGDFSIKTAYEDLVEGHTTHDFLPWRRVWSWYGPQRIKTFFWLLLNNGILVNEERARRCISSTTICSMCGDRSESGMHMLRDCPDAKKTWEGLLRYGGVDGFFDMSLHLTEWVIRNVSSKLLLGSGMRWCTIFGVGCWLIWKKRCGFIFKGERKGPGEIIARILTMAKNVEEARLTDVGDTRLSTPPMLVGWRPPALDHLKLNTDASLQNGSGRAFGGGLIRDAAGLWRYGFVVNIGVCSILTAEIWCLYHGLHLAKSLGIRKLEVESDNFVGVAMILGQFETSINCRSIVKRVRGLLQDFDFVALQHVHREGNFAADFLSHYAYSYHRGVHELEAPPAGLHNWMLHDRLGVAYIR